MSNAFSAPNDAIATESSPAARDNAGVQITLRLRPVDHSDRALVANVSTARLASGMVFLDFGFVEQQAIEDVTRAARAGKSGTASLDGRLESRIAMSPGDAAQLMQQLQQLLQTMSSRQKAPSAAAAEPQEPFALDGSASLQ